MGIAEAQLESWSAQGKTGQFTDTYKSISANLLDGGAAPYPVKNVEAHLQGSYGNDTNVCVKSHPTPTPFRVQFRPPQVGLERAYPCSA